jgi:peptide/nickel transport system substrate-binding protein
MSIRDIPMIQRVVSRRTFLAGAVATTAATLLAACGSDDDNAATKAPTSSGSGTGGQPTTSTGETSPTAAAGTESPAGSPVTGGGDAGEATPGGEIIIGTLGEAKSINPFASNETEGDWRCKMLYEEFVRLDPATFEPKPALAQSWENKDLVFTFTLQPDLKFSDGSPLTADDIAFTITGMLKKETASPRASYFTSIQGAEEYSSGSADSVTGVKVVDPKTIEITLATPDASFLINMRYVTPVPKAMLDGKDLSNSSQDPFFQNPIGAGPFKFVSWAVGGDFVAERNENYYQQGKPYLDKFTHRVIPDSQSLVNSLLSGDIDGSIYPSPAGADQLKANKDLAVVVSPFTSPDGWQFNFEANPYLAKKEVRQAVAYALDMDQFSQDSLYGLGKPGVGPIAPANWAFDKDLQPYKQDMDKAKQLIEQAGPPPSGIKFMVNKGNVLREDCLTYTQAQLKELGWTIEPEVIEWATLTDRVTRKDFMVLGSVFAGVTVDPGELKEQFGTGGSQNYSNYSNPDLDKLLDQATQELDRDKAKDLYDQIQEILMDELPTYFAWYRPFLHVIKAKYQGWVDTSDTGGLFYELENVYIKE